MEDAQRRSLGSAGSDVPPRVGSAEGLSDGPIGGDWHRRSSSPTLSVSTTTSGEIVEEVEEGPGEQQRMFQTSLGKDFLDLFA